MLCQVVIILRQIVVAEVHLVAVVEVLDLREVVVEVLLVQAVAVVVMEVQGANIWQMLLNYLIKR